jgi:flagellar hook-associated protein 3 FlgL
LIGASTVSNPAAFVGGPFTIDFTTPTAYTVTNAAHATVATGTYTDGQTIAFSGAQVTLSGTPAANDTFGVAASTNQSLFTTVQNLVTALQTGVTTPGSSTSYTNAVSAQINNIDQALAQTSDVRATVGGRLNAITTQQSVAGSQQVQLKTTISSLVGLDYASAITTLDQQNTTLSAALQAFTMTQGLSLFKFIQ